MIFAHGSTVTRLRRQMVVDPYSGVEELGSWDLPEESPLSGAVAPSSTTEQVFTDGRQVETQVSFYGDLDVDLKAEDRIRDGSRTWECDGDPQPWKNPFTGWEAGSETRLKRVSPDGL